MTAEIRLFSCLSDNFGYLTHDPVTKATASIDAPEAGSIIKAFVMLAPGYTGSEALRDSMRAHVKKHLAPWQQPRAIDFVDALPMTTTGKILRRQLRDAERAKLAGRASAS